MFRKIDDFINEWKTESAATLKILDSITNNALFQKVYPEGRNLGDISNHIVLSIGKFISTAGFDSTSQEVNTDINNDICQIINNFTELSNIVIHEVQTKWNDSELSEDLNMYGELWKKGFVLESLIRHIVHHRGQMTILMRQANLKVPGVYGPSKEEWIQYDLEPAK